jgi:hypothetical protein
MHDSDLPSDKYLIAVFIVGACHVVVVIGRRKNILLFIDFIASYTQ